MKKIRQFAHKTAALALVAPFLMANAFAQTTGSGVDASLDAVDLSGVATKVGAAALLIVGIALVFKGPDLAKRVIRKV